MTWDDVLNDELLALCDAHSSAMIDTREFRQRRRMLVRDAARREGAGGHTLRRPLRRAMAGDDAMPPAAATPPPAPRSEHRRRGFPVWPLWLLAFLLGGLTGALAVLHP